MTKICAVAVRPDDGTRAVVTGADAVEFRLDLFPAVPDDFSFFSQPVPTIVTFRGCQEREIYEHAFASGATYADIEGYSEFRDEFPGRTICSLHDFD
ncbi:MAG TPA: type I 3-dehydroquinate dehydratase, partial [Methanocorpusculum sp.]|nr:type I 3-dehydroquinate dehydratase [Methanocorpusculum sp.]